MRFTKAYVSIIAKDFLMSSQAKIWPFVQDEIRDALIDQIIVGCVRSAATVATCAPFAPDELLEFRAAIVSMLDAGIPMGSAGRRRLMFDRTHEIVRPDGAIEV